MHSTKVSGPETDRPVNESRMVSAGQPIPSDYKYSAEITSPARCTAGYIRAGTKFFIQNGYVGHPTQRQPPSLERLRQTAKTTAINILSNEGEYV